MFCSLLGFFFPNLFLGVVERTLGIPKRPFALCTGFERFVLNAFHAAGHLMPKWMFFYKHAVNCS